MTIGSGPNRTPPVNGVDGTPETTEKIRKTKKSVLQIEMKTENRIYVIFLMYMAIYIARENTRGLDGNVL